MPIIEMHIGGTPRRVQVDDGYTPEDLDHIAQQLSGGEKKADDSTALGRAASYVGGKIMETGMAASRLTDPHNLSRPWTETASDALTAGAPLVAPIPSLVGTATGAGVRALGGGEDVADLANAGTQVGTGLVQAGKAAMGLKGTVAARFAKVAAGAEQKGLTLVAGSEQGQTLKAALEHALERFAPGSTERHVAEGVLAKLAPEAGSTPFSGGGLTYQNLDDALTNVQGLKGESAIAGIIRKARDSLLRGTPEAGALKSTLGASRRAGQTIPGLSALTRGGGYTAAGYEALRGHYGRAAAIAGATTLGAGSLPSVGQALTAAPVLGRASLSAGAAIRPSLTGGTPAAVDDTAPDETAPTQESPPPTQTAPNRAEPSQVVKGRFGREIGAVAQLVGLPPELLHSVMMQESGGNTQALSSGGVAGTPAHGLLQVTPDTFKSVAPQVAHLVGRQVSVDNPLDNLIAGGVLWRKYLDMTGGDVQKAGALYYGSPGHPLSEQYGREIVGRLAKFLPAAGQASAAPTPEPTPGTVLPDYPGGEAQHAHDRDIVLGNIP